MTPKQFLKKYVPKEQRLEADEQLEEILNNSEEAGFEEAKEDISRYLRGWANEIRSW